MTNSPPTPATLSPIVGLDLLRLFAAVLVMIFHLGYLSWGPVTGARAIPITPFASYPSLTPFVWYGAVGVDIFFVISGFVILHSARGSAFSFFRSRILRLVPGALLCASITAAVALWHELATPGTILVQWLKSVMFLPFAPWIDGVYWTLGIEIAFYSMVLAMIFFSKQSSFRAFLLLIGCACMAYWAFKFADAQLDLPSLPVPGRIVQLLLLRDGASFAIGGLLWLQASGHGQANDRLWVLAFMAIIMAKLTVQMEEVFPKHLHEVLVFTPSLVWAASVGLIVASIRYNAQLSAYLSPQLTRMCGIATYPLYLLHNIVGVALMALVLTYTGSDLLALPTAMILIFGMSLAVAKFGEPPIRTQIASLLNALGRRMEGKF